MFRRSVVTLIMLSLLGLTSGCAKRTYIADTWENPNRTTDKLDRIAVLALLDSPDRSNGFEDEMVASLHAHDIPAVAGHEIMNERRAYDRAEMESMLEAAEAEGVLIFKLISVENNYEYRPPTTYVAPAPYDALWVDDPFFHYYYPAPDYYSYWYPAYQVTTTPGYWENSTAYTLEASLFNNDNDRLIWSARTVTEDPVQFGAVADQVSETVAERLAQKAYAGID